MAQMLRQPPAEHSAADRTGSHLDVRPDRALGVILRGGAGTRLYPLTAHRSKPAVPLAGKYRLVDVPISNCINSGVNRMFVLTQYNSASLNGHIARSYRFDRFRSGFVTILAAEQTQSSREWFQGTADAVRQVMPHLKGFQHDYVMILSGDQLYSMDYCDLLAHHTSHDADVTIATIPVAADDAPAFGILKTDEENLITEFHEKPARDELEGKDSPVSTEMEQAGRVYLASMGIYIFDKKVLKNLLDSRPEHHDFGHQIIPRAIDELRVVSYPFGGYWSDIGTIRSFYDANLMLAQTSPPFSLYRPEAPIYTNARMLAPAKIQSSFVQESLVAEGSVVVNSQISNSVIGIRSFIGNNTTIKNTVFMGADYYPWHATELRDVVAGPERSGVAEESYIEGAIIDKNVSIGKRCIIKNQDNVQDKDGDNYYIRDGIVVIPKNAVIPDDTII